LSWDRLQRVATAVKRRGARRGGRASYSASAGLPFDDAELESKLVWIFGSPRSGSTWLLRMLCPALLPDSQRFKRGSHRELGFSWGPNWNGLARTLQVDEFRIGPHLAPPSPAPARTGQNSEPAAKLPGGGTLPQTLPRANDYFSSYAFSAAYADVWRPEFRRMTLVRLHAVIDRAREAGLNLPADDPLLVIKEVNGTHAADLLMSLFPRSRMIFLVRDGRDVLDSLVDANKPGGWLTKGGRGRALETADQRLVFVRQRAMQWRSYMTACLQAYEGHDSELRFKVRYEDLLATTEVHLTELYRWLGLPSEADRVAAIAEEHAFSNAPEGARGPGKPWRSATPGGWREGLTPTEQDTANEIMGPMLAELGYDV
jgi:sulfotransferase family protein